MSVDPDEPLITGEMVGIMFVFGADLILIAGALAVVDVVSWTAAGVVTLLVCLLFGSWIGVRWRARRASAAADADERDADPVETLKRRYAAGEITDEEFERRLDRLLAASERREGSTASAEPTASTGSTRPNDPVPPSESSPSDAARGSDPSAPDDADREAEPADVERGTARDAERTDRRG